MLADVAQQPDVGSVVSPYDPAGAAQISDDGTIAYAQLTFTKQADALEIDDVNHVIDVAQGASTDSLQVELGGQAISNAEGQPGGLTELVAIVAAAIVLLLAFGSLFAMLLPVINAIFAVGTGLMLVTLLSHVASIPEATSILGSLIGLGVGIDYALFIVTRHRNGIRRGLSPAESAVKALNTSGRAVAFAGGTVCIALLGMFALDMTFLNGVAIGASITVVFAVLAAITLLPAMFRLLGMRVLSRRERRRLALHGADPEEPTGAAARWAALVERRPKALAAVAFGLVALLAIPLFSLHLGTVDQGSNPESTTSRQAYDLLAEGFGPGFNGPLQVVASLDGPADQAALQGLVGDLGRTPGVVEASLVTPPDSPTAVVQVVPSTSPQDIETDRLIDRLRDDVIPAAEQGSGMRAYVGGVTAINKDFATVVGDKLPLFVAVIVGLGFLLLLVAFRSVVVPLTAAVMNLLAAAASFGMLVALFQWGWITDLLGLGDSVPIMSFLPVIMLALLFGLSMDYQVFLVSRMHEEWVHTRDNRRAVRVGQTETSRVISCAAIIMVCVFSAFVLSGDIVGSMAGIGLAAAVALDAFILRSILVPALMHLLGSRNWWLPRWLDLRLPHLAVEPADEAIAPPSDSGDEPERVLTPARD
jgi:putative drug exporter of the RND superfamily